jgi:hypothetical protein
LAQQALSFERQEPINFIHDQYWEEGSDGLLGAQRLLRDLDRLDQHRFTTERRKRELTKTISLASMAPVEFQRLREEGITKFMTLLEWFDRDFPGHYLRLIKNVSLTFVALVPPTEGIHATLSNSGVSRVMVGPPFAEPRTILRLPEAISLTVANEGTGLFEVNLRDAMLLPFEGSGVETTWTLELPHAANRFDFRTLVDVVMKIQYTALEDWGYKKKVLERLGADNQGRVTIEAQTYFSARNSFPDTWYHFRNPVFLANSGDYGYESSQTPPPYSLRMELSQSNFPPNQEQHRLKRVLLAATAAVPKVPVEISFTPAGGNTAYSVQGKLEESRLTLVGTQTFPIQSLSPFGAWMVRVRNEADPAEYPDTFNGASTLYNQRKLNLDWLEDLLLVFEYEAKTRYPPYREITA